MGKNSSKLKPEDLKTLMRETSFTTQEVQDWYKMFMKDYPTGQLDVEQFKKLYVDIFPSGNADSFVEHAFRTFDKDGDGFVVFREFLAAMSISKRGTLEDKLKWAFSMYDIDRNGYITKYETIQIVKTIYKALGSVVSLLPKDMSTPEKCADKIFDITDKDQDNRISLQEFIEGAKKDGTMICLLDA